MVDRQQDALPKEPWRFATATMVLDSGNGEDVTRESRVRSQLAVGLGVSTGSRADGRPGREMVDFGVFKWLHKCPAWEA